MARRAPINLGQTRRGGAVDFSLAIVNIVLLLVFFFLITGTLVDSDELIVDLAETEQLPLDRLPRPLLVMLPGGAWSLDGNSISKADLAAALLSDDADGDGPVLHLLPDKDLPASEILSLLGDPALQDVAVKLVTLRVVPEAGQ
ncbi:MAG: biopolymer transporter ExbD [Pseudomonadota bacterium]